MANYTDDFVISTKTKKGLKERTIQFVKIAEKHNLYFKQSKYDFDIKEIPTLEVVFGRGKVAMENDKSKVVKEWKTPTKIKLILGLWHVSHGISKIMFYFCPPMTSIEVKSFLEFANFY